jgi:hypothetical protein
MISLARVTERNKRSKVMKEYGGYLPLELNIGKEHYTGDNVIRFNCARSAMGYIVKNNTFSKIYVPVYICKSVYEALKRYSVEIVSYHIDSAFSPIVESIDRDAIIIITNYYGIYHNLRDYVKKYGNVIFDNTQAFFEPPIDGAYNIYSCRKFFGVCDGAYLIGKEKGVVDLQQYIPLYGSYLYRVYDTSTNDMYEESLRNEEQLENSEICIMSKFSEKMLSSINYDNVKQKRLENYQILHNQFKNINELECEYDVTTVPMVYPLMVQDSGLREYLVKSNIYVPQWWKWVLEENVGNDFEQLLSKYLIPLPIDQRYDEKDMWDIIKIVNKYGIR